MQRFGLPAEIPHSLEERMERIQQRKQQQSRRVALVHAPQLSKAMICLLELFCLPSQSWPFPVDPSRRKLLWLLQLLRQSVQVLKIRERADMEKHMLNFWSAPRVPLKEAPAA